MLNESIMMAWENIISNRMRSFLTTLGIVIGIASVIALITVVQGVTGKMMSQFDELGVGNLTITANGTAIKTGLSDTEINKLSQLSHVSGVSPSAERIGTTEYGGIVEEDVSLKGRNDVYFDHKSGKVKLGRGFNRLDMNSTSNVCVLNESMAETFFPGVSPIDETIKINGRNYKIVGVMENDDSLMPGLSGADPDDPSVIIPYQNAMKLLGISSTTNIEMYVSDSAYTDIVEAEATKILDSAFNYKEDSYSVMNMDSLIDTMTSIKSMLTMMLVGIASISLLVGGIGIMNMMLTTVSERTKEIGLRKALGAEPGQIQLQFIVESIFLSLIGGGIGVVIGLLLSYMICMIIGTDFIISIFAIALGVGFSAGVGIIFGWSPARKASRLNPIDALRSE